MTSNRSSINLSIFTLVHRLWTSVNVQSCFFSLASLLYTQVHNIIPNIYMTAIFFVKTIQSTNLSVFWLMNVPFQYLFVNSITKRLHLTSFTATLSNDWQIINIARVICAVQPHLSVFYSEWMATIRVTRAFTSPIFHFPLRPTICLWIYIDILENSSSTSWDIATIRRIFT